MNSAEVRALLAMIASAYDRDIPVGKDVVWIEALSDLPSDLGRAAVIEAIRTETYPPTAATIRTAAEKLRAARAALARRDMHARAIAAAPVPEDHARPDGAQMVSYVLGELARAREAEGGPLGRERAGEQALRAVEIWRQEHPQSTIAQRPGHPCTNPACRCTHSGGCDGGWIQHSDEGVRPCPSCSPRRAQILAAHDGRRVTQANLRDLSDLQKRSQP